MSVITLDEAREYLQIDASDTDNDDLITALTERASKSLATRYSPFAFEKVDGHTEVLDGGDIEFILEKRPVIEVTSVTDLEYDDVLVEDDDYSVDLEEGFVTKLLGRFGSGRKRWEIVYDAGYMDGQGAEVFPADVQQAALMLVSSWYNRRDPKKTSESIGDYAYKIETEEGAVSEVDRIMDPYSEPSF